MAVQKMVSEIQPAAGAMAAAYTLLDTSERNDYVHASIDDVREEVDDAMGHAKVFYQLNPDEAMRFAGGYSARMSELVIRIKRVEANQPGWRAIRVDEVEPCREEMRFQYENHSRLHTAREFDWKVEAGER